MKTRIIITLAWGILLCLAGCIPFRRTGQIPVSGNLDPTALMKTIYGQLTAYAPVTTTPRTPSAPQSTPTPRSSPSTTSTFLISPTALLTATPAIPVAVTRVDSNCRSGPGIIYPITGFLLAGDQVTLLGRLVTNSWWVIQNPMINSRICWLWSGATTVYGDVSILPIVAEPPPPAATNPPEATQPPGATSTPTIGSTNTLSPTNTPQPTQIGTPTSTPQPTQVGTPTPTPQPTATNTPEPTNTPKPTNTDKPKPTHKPTNTPKAVTMQEPTNTPQPYNATVPISSPLPTDTPQLSAFLQSAREFGKFFGYFAGFTNWRWDSFVVDWQFFIPSPILAN